MPSPQTLILICGLPGSGKTTLAAALSKKLGLVCLHKDSIKESLYDSMGFSTLNDSRKLGPISVRLLYDLADEQLGRGVSIILEAPFNFETDYPRIREWEEKYQCAIYTVICSASDEERLKRFIERPRHASHHDVDRTLTLGGGEVYEKIPGRHIKVVSDRAVEELVDNVVQLISV